MVSDAEDQTWQVGQLAAATGLTVRTLRHYDEIGLLTPSARDGAGPRRYTGTDVRRLRDILALRGLGLSLAEIHELLGGGDVDVEAVIAEHLRSVEASIAAQRDLARVLTGLLGKVRAATEVDAGILLSGLEDLSAAADHLTADQLRELVASRRRLTEQWSADELAELTARRRRHLGTLPAHPYAGLFRQLPRPDPGDPTDPTDPDPS